MPFHDLLPLAQTQSNGTREVIDGLARTPLSQVVIFVFVLSVVRVALFPYMKNTRPHLRTGLFVVAKFFNEMLDAFIYAGVFVFMLIRPFAVQAFLVPSGSMWPTLYVNDFIVANKAVYRYSKPKVGDVIVFRPPAVAAITDKDLDAQHEMKVDYVKRCIGAPGDVVELKKGVLYRNGAKVDEPYVTYSKCTDHPADGEECQEFAKLSDDEKKQIDIPSFKLVKYQGNLIPLNYTESDANAPVPSEVSPIDHFPVYHSSKEFLISDPAEQKKAMALPAEKIPEGMYLMMGDNRNNSHDGRVWGLITRDEIIGRSEFVWWPLSQVHMTR